MTTIWRILTWFKELLTHCAEMVYLLGVQDLFKFWEGFAFLCQHLNI